MKWNEIREKIVRIKGRFIVFELAVLLSTSALVWGESLIDSYLIKKKTEQNFTDTALRKFINRLIYVATFVFIKLGWINHWETKDKRKLFLGFHKKMSLES